MARLNPNTTDGYAPRASVSQAEINAQVEKMAAEVKAMPRREITLPLIDPKDTHQEMSVNCYTLLVPRGVTVSVPECFIEVMDRINEATLNRMRADAEAAKKSARFMGAM